MAGRYLKDRVLLDRLLPFGQGCVRGDDMMPLQMKLGAALCAVLATVVGGGSAMAAGDRTPDADDWMKPPCLRPLSPSFPVRPPECNDPKAPKGPDGQPLPAPAAAAPSAPAAPPPPQPIEVAQDGAKAKAIRLSRVRSAVRDGEKLGEIKFGVFCNGTVPLTMNSRVESSVLAAMLRPVRDEFSRAGYADLGGDRGLFEEESDQTRVDLQLGALLQEFKVRYCPSAGGARVDGNVSLKVRWQLYDPIARKILFTKETEGNYQTSGSEQMREAELFGAAYRKAVRELLADRKFYELAVDTVAPAATVASAEPRPGAVVLKRVPPFSGPLSASMTNVRAAVVTVSQGAGSGSGFFVGENGYVVTNSHVVGGNRFVRVKLITGRELVGEVVKQDSARDVALIKTEGRNFVALPIATGESNVGSEVTSIGSPLGESLSGTVTRGIVSAYRVMNNQRYIQSDVGILPGNSGGPLLDGSGRVVGISVLMRANAAGRVNFFIPIQEALDTLELRLAD